MNERRFIVKVPLKVFVYLLKEEVRSLPEAFEPSSQPEDEEMFNTSSTRPN